MKALELRNILNEYIDAGIVDADAEVEFLLVGDDWNSGSNICNTLAVRDGDNNNKLFLTNFDKVIK